MNNQTKELYLYDPTNLGLRLDETVKVLKEFRENLPIKLSRDYKVSKEDISYIQAILNVIDYIEVPQYISEDAGAEA